MDRRESDASLASHAAAVIDTDRRAIVLDFSTGSMLGGERIVDMDTGRLSAAINAAMADADTAYAFGRYGEPRELYHNDLFAVEESAERRTIHMGIDVFCAAGSPVYSPLDSVVEIVANNTRELDYGPVIVLRHDDDIFTLYGHLSLDALAHVEVGQGITAGQRIGWIGAPPDNGNWPPHLHFQVIRDLLDRGADFPGVAPPSERDYWLDLSPSPARFFPECSPEELEYR